jgi:hypothetical protein
MNLPFMEYDEALADAKEPLELPLGLGPTLKYPGL